MKICMGCMNQVSDNDKICPACGYDQSNVREKSYYLDPGTIIGGKFIVGKALEYGGYTVKYLGFDAEAQHKVIISEYLPSDFSTRSDGESEVTIYSGDAYEQFSHGLETFLNEGNKIQQLADTQGVAKVYDCIAENDTGYVISEYLVGTTLKEVLDTGKVYKPEEAKQFISQILIGLIKVHPLDIIHCDIAPETIFITEQGEVKLLDFGATRYVTTANSKSLAIILKQGYAPEEQYRSQGKRGPWTDVYALAAVMYRMITGKVPPESVDRALSDEITEPSKLNTGISQSMENALMNALNVYQDDRTKTAQEFYKELNSSDTKRRKVKRAKRDTGKMPIWVKGLVAVVGVAVIAGGAVVIKGLHDGGSSNQGATQEKFKIVSEVKSGDMTLADFDKEWTDFGLKKENRTVEYRYDPNNAEGTVLEYNDMTNDVLKDGRTLDEVNSDIKKNRTVYANVIVASTKNVTFSEKWLKNCTNTRWAQSASVKKRIKVSKDVYMQSYIPDGVSLKKGDDTQAYGTLSKIIYDKNTIDLDAIRKKYTSDTAKADSEIKKQTAKINGMDTSKKKIQFIYHTGAYYTMSKVNCKRYGTFEGKSISSVKFVYSKNPKDHKTGNRARLRTLSSDKYSSAYISFRYGRGTIVKVLSKSLKNKKGYDGRNDDSENGDGKLFATVRSHVSINSLLTVARLKRYVSNAGASLGTKYPDNYIVKKVWVNGKSNVTEFKQGDRLKISAEPKPTPKPVVTRKPQTATKPSGNSSGSTSKKSDSDGSSKKHQTDSDKHRPTINNY